MFSLKPVVFFLALVLLGAGCTAREPSQTTTSPAEEPQAASPSEPGASSEWTTWKTSKDNLLFSVPSNWTVKQADTGGGSVVAVTPEGERDAAILFTIRLAKNESGDEVLYRKWQDNLVSPETRTDCEAAVLGGFHMDCFEDAGLRTYTADTQDGRFVAIQYNPGHPESQLLQVIAMSSTFRPAPVLLEQAQTIP